MGQQKTISSRELAKALGTSPQRIGSWIRRGMPVVGRNGCYQFDADAVEAWLLAQGFIAPAEPGAADAELTHVVTNRQEVADHMNVGCDQVSAWHRDPTFPGRPSSPGRRDGYYNLAEIERWHDRYVKPRDPAQRDGGDGAVRSERARLLALQCEQRELKLRQARGELIAVADVIAFQGRMINQMAATIDEIPDRVFGVLPHDLPDETRDAVRDALAGVTQDLRLQMAEFGEGDADDETDDG